MNSGHFAVVRQRGLYAGRFDVVPAVLIHFPAEVFEGHSGEPGAVGELESRDFELRPIVAVEDAQLVCHAFVCGGRARGHIVDVGKAACKCLGCIVTVVISAAGAYESHAQAGAKTVEEFLIVASLMFLFY